MPWLLAAAAVPLLPPPCAHGSARRAQRGRALAPHRQAYGGLARHAAAPPPPLRSQRAQRTRRTQRAEAYSVALAPTSLSSTLSVSLPAWLALALTAFMAAFAGLCVLVIREMLPALREVKLSAQSVKLACTGVVDACDEVEKLAVLMAADIKSVEEGISKPLQTLTRVASTFNSRTTMPSQALQDILEDPDTKLLQQVAGSVRDSTEKNVRERLRRWVASLERIRGVLQPAVPPATSTPARLNTSSGGPERAAVEAWAGAASAVAAAETAAAKLELAVDACQTAGLCADLSLLAAAAEDAAERDADGQQPFNPS